MGFHDHLYASNYYNEEELLASDEYPPALVNICARYCVNHLSKTLLEKIPVPTNEVVEPQISDCSSRTSQPAVETPPAIAGYLPTKQYRLRAGVCLPSELSEKIFAYLDKHTTAAKLLRGGESSSSSSSSSSGGSSSSEDEGDEERGMDDDRVAGDGNVDVLRRRRRRRRRRMRRRGVVLVNEQHVRVRRSGGAGRRKKRMLWNGGIVGGDGEKADGSNPDQQEVSEFEVVGFDDIVEPLFGDSSHLPLTKLNLRTSTAVNDDILSTLMSHYPRELDIHECPKLTSTSLQTINSKSKNLVSLVIGTSTQILPTIFLSPSFQQDFLNCPKLMKLVIWNLTTNVSLYWGHLTSCFANTLTSLDLSGCGEIEDFEFLRKCLRLRSLVLCNVLISGRIPGDKKLGSEEVEDDEMSGEEVPIDRSRYVLFLKDEDELQRPHGGGDRDRDGEEGIEPADEGGGQEEEERVRDPVGSFAFRRRLEGLVNKLISPICQLKDLRFLDISTSSDPSTSGTLQASHVSNLIGSDPTIPWSTYPNPNQVLSTLVQNLPKLTHLDISGTNLAGRGVAVLMNQPMQVESMDNSSEADKLCDIPGLNSRVNNPLEFLGLYGTAHDASHRHCIPAKRISGDKDETQILVSCEAYIHRHEVLEKVLNDLFHLFRSERGTHITQSLRLILRAMNLHPSEKHVQISGSASLFYIVKNEQHSQAGGGSSDEAINPPMKRMILSTIVNAMAIHKVDSTMARNGCLTICHFRIPQDVMFIYAKLVKILLKILGQSIGPHQRHESFVERIAIYLLNSLACQVEGWHKRLVGDLGAMKRMLQLIRDRLARLECDDVMEIAWSTMWNVTDETPENCEKFLKNEGMVLFLKCLQTFPNKPELLRNMMGLLGNVAEVGALRKQLMTSEFISVFCELLDSTQDNIEVSYNAAGVLAHILSDGEEAWGIASPSRTVIQESMVRNVNRWNINSTRNINYRSFEPILRLLRINHTRECQLWASWALANLTRVYPEKYVPLVEKENGLSPLRDLLEEPLTPATSTVIQEDVKKYARITLRNVDEYNKSGKIDLNSFMDG